MNECLTGTSLPVAFRILLQIPISSTFLPFFDGQDLAASGTLLSSSSSSSSSSPSSATTPCPRWSESVSTCCWSMASTNCSIVICRPARAISELLVFSTSGAARRLAEGGFCCFEVNEEDEDISEMEELYSVIVFLQVFQKVSRKRRSLGKEGLSENRVTEKRVSRKRRSIGKEGLSEKRVSRKRRSLGKEGLVVPRLWTRDSGTRQFLREVLGTRGLEEFGRSSRNFRG